MANSVVLAGVPEVIADTGLNDSDKTITNTAANGYVISVHGIYVTLTTTATAGDRQMRVQLRDASAVVLGEAVAGVVQAASLTYAYYFAPGNPDLTAIRDAAYSNDGTVLTPLPGLWLMRPGWDLRIFDSTAVAAAADDMTYQAVVSRWSADAAAL